LNCVIFEKGGKYDINSAEKGNRLEQKSLPDVNLMIKDSREMPIIVGRN
jgi:hypothetical protein